MGNNQKYYVEFTTAIEVEADSISEAKKKAYYEKQLGAPGCCAVYELDEHKKYARMGIRQEVTPTHDRPSIRKLGYMANQNICDDVSLDSSIDSVIEIVEVLANELGLTLEDIHNWSEKYDSMHTNYILEKQDNNKAGHRL